MKRLSVLALFISASAAFAAEDPKTAARLATFNKDIKPIIDKSCISCHGKDGKKPSGKFNATTLEGLEKGGEDEGKGIIWGDAAKSPLYHLAYLGATDRDQDKAMPPKKKKNLSPLATEELAKIKAWIEAK